MTAVAAVPQHVVPHPCPRCGQEWVELTRVPCPRCEMPFDTTADGSRIAGFSRVADDTTRICGRCTDHESLLDLRDEPLPPPGEWPIHPNKINRELAQTYGDREHTKLLARRLESMRDHGPEVG